MTISRENCDSFVVVLVKNKLCVRPQSIFEQKNRKRMYCIPLSEPQFYHIKVWYKVVKINECVFMIKRFKNYCHQIYLKKCINLVSTLAP